MITVNDFLGLLSCVFLQVYQSMIVRGVCAGGAHPVRSLPSPSPPHLAQASGSPNSLMLIGPRDQYRPFDMTCYALLVR